MVTDDVSYSAWVKPNTVAPMGIITRGDNFGGQMDRYINLLAQASGKFIFDIRGNGSGSTITVSITGNTIYSTGAWYHIVCVRDKGNNLYLYVNGISDAPPVADNAGNIEKPGFSGSRPLSIGAQNVGSAIGNYFTGAIDDVRIYKSALSQAQIQQLYAEGLSSHSLAQQ